ncbi:MAG: hypothetical protein E3J72_08110 [Planctomycetota bacterium]|nr:MAG: hypothetical protein E3J72_08110 [Planctomycetota bacterium]
MPNTIRTGYSAKFSLTAPAVKLKANTSGTSLVFEVTTASGTSMVMRYRQAGSSSWSESTPLNSPQTGDEITISGLTEGETYEFLPLATSETAGRGTRSDPGNILRIVPSSGSALEKIKSQVGAELATWVPSGNIVIGTALRGKLDLGQKAALISGKRTGREREASGTIRSKYEITIELYYSHHDAGERENVLDSLAEEIAAHFDNNSSSFSGISGYFDTAADKVSHDSPGRDIGRAIVILSCLVID